MRAVVWIAICAFALATANAVSASSTATTALRVTYWQDGAKASSSVVWTLHCDPADGSLPRAARACGRLASGGAKLFASLPRDIACTQIYGGPQKARVVGTVLGTRVWATFTRADGCQIGRWNQLSPWLVPPGGVG